jgi:hypothetical protein
MHIDDSMTNMPTMVNSRTPALSEVQIMIIPLSNPYPAIRDIDAAPRRL